MTRKECLDLAAEIVLKDRNRQYGEPEDNFGKIAGMWGVYLGRPVSPCDVACLLSLLKIVRAKSNPHNRDSWIDLAGYAACGAECADKMCGCEVIEGLAGMAGEIPKETEPDTWDEFLEELKKRVKTAEEKHPLFAEGVYQAVGIVSEEVGELNQAINKSQGEDRIDAENWDVIITAFRFWRGDWKRPENSRPEETAAVLEKKDIPSTGAFSHGVLWGTGLK